VIDAAHEAQPAVPSRRAALGRWTGVVAACSLALAVVFGLLFANQLGQTNTLIAQLSERDQALQQLRGQFEQERQQLIVQLGERDRQIQEIDNQLGRREQTIQELNRLIDERERTIEQINLQLERERKETVFVSNAISQTLNATQAGAGGKMFMQPGHNHAVLFVSGLKQPAAGTIYQFWFATGNQQVPSDTFTVGPDGAAVVPIDAPAAVDGYSQIMVTVEPESGSRQPSDEVVLEARL
jgi:hypothetical protein